MLNDLLLILYIYFGILVVPYLVGCILEHIDRKRKEEKNE